MSPEELQTNERRVRDATARENVEWYVRHRGYWHDWTQKATLAGRMRLGPDDGCLDAGCGVGRLALEFAPRVNSVTAVDFSAASIEVLRERIRTLAVPNVQAAVGDLSVDLPFAAETFTRLWSVETLQHVHVRRPTVDVLREFRRVLRPGGICGTMNYLWRGHGERAALYGDGIYRYHYTADEMTSYFRAAGFESVVAFPVVVVPRRWLRWGWVAAAGVRLQRWMPTRFRGEFLWCEGRVPAGKAVS